jgi:chromosome segregation ATPase
MSGKKPGFFRGFSKPLDTEGKMSEETTDNKTDNKTELMELKEFFSKQMSELRFEIEGLRSDYQSIKRNLKDLESDFRSEKSIDSAVLEMARFKERRYPLNGNAAMEEIKPYW